MLLSGASVGRYDGLTGTTIPSLDGVGQSGFWTGSGKGQYFVPSVPSGGPYGVTWGQYIQQAMIGQIYCVGKIECVTRVIFMFPLL